MNHCFKEDCKETVQQPFNKDIKNINRSNIYRKRGYSMQYIRAPLGPNPSSPITSSREMSSLISASITTQKSQVLQITKSKPQERNNHITHSIYPSQQDNQNFQQQDQGSQHELFVVKPCSVHTNSNNM